MQEPVMSLNSEIGLSRTMKNIIEKVMSTMAPEDAFDENKLLFAITDYFMEKYPWDPDGDLDKSDKLEYQLKRMKMETTGQIKQAITIYMTRYKDVR